MEVLVFLKRLNTFQESVAKVELFANFVELASEDDCCPNKAD
jgi:hypothetical protein